MRPSLFSNAEDVSSIVLVLYCKQNTRLSSRGFRGKGRGKGRASAPDDTLRQKKKKTYTHTVAKEKISLLENAFRKNEKIKRKKIYFYK